MEGKKDDSLVHGDGLFAGKCLVAEIALKRIFSSVHLHVCCDPLQVRNDNKMNTTFQRGKKSGTKTPFLQVFCHHSTKTIFVKSWQILHT